VLAELHAAVDRVDETPVTMAALRSRLPQPLYAELRISFIRAKDKAASDDITERIFSEEIADTQAALAGNGFIVHTPERQALLSETAVALGWSDELLAAMLRVNRTTIPRWTFEGYTSAPTLEDVQSQKDAYAAIVATQIRRDAYAALRERWIASYGEGLRWINSQDMAGVQPPSASDVVAAVWQS
jgi:hypothetical protein